ncbi:hypothetical protein PB01_02755 [Psychrobacillus glaciei]|uniref:Lipoprotein n=1 Tax=Psychrobacillus glaciei TaxID=2283160 RepID=A0A5J6SJJ4_9BACI|nr:hypothetical protein [Psychrobacillus glaciei]QFF97819.1 hypothetical protein PB01_02755 [Psychrobacillus glaciei]
MKYFTTLFTGLFSIVLLAGCNFIAESYDYSPPSVTFSHSGLKLAEANINWEKDGTVKKIDSLELAREQKQGAVKAGQEDSIYFGGQDFDILELTVSVWRDDEQIQLDVNYLKEFNFPDEKGEYLIEVNLTSDFGTAQYVGNIVVD